MINPLEKKRQTYLTFYADGVRDGILNGKQDSSKTFSMYYKKGFRDGLDIGALVNHFKMIKGDDGPWINM